MAGEAAQTLKCNKWVLKVPIHCLGCKREIKKLLHSIDGVYTTNIDPLQQQVTVTGNVDSEILVKKLLKTGKHAELCPEKAKKNEKSSDPKAGQNKNQMATNVDVQKKANKPADSKAPTNSTPEKNSDNKSGGQATEVGSTGESKKTKKGKGQKGNSVPASIGLLNADQGKCLGGGVQVNHSPAFEQLGAIMANGGSPTVQVLSYNAAYPSKVGHGLAYQVPSAYISHNTSTAEAENYQVEATAFNSFDIFSDENPNGCSVM